MARAKHTPGPWAPDFGEVTRIRDTSGSTVASCSHVYLTGRRNIEEVEANARLIAAAPEMLEALRAYADLSWPVDDPADMLRRLRENARTIVAKAEYR